VQKLFVPYQFDNDSYRLLTSSLETNIFHLPYIYVINFKINLKETTSHSTCQKEK
jgi:hypothetical protein